MQKGQFVNVSKKAKCKCCGSTSVAWYNNPKSGKWSLLNIDTQSGMARYKGMGAWTQDFHKCSEIGEIDKAGEYVFCPDGTWRMTLDTAIREGYIRVTASGHIKARD